MNEMYPNKYQSGFPSTLIIFFLAFVGAVVYILYK